MDPSAAATAGSPWLAADSSLRMPRLEEPAEADVAVLGGGICGVAAALRLARDGFEVVLLEAREIGSGTTGHSTAKLSALHGDAYGSIARAAGDQAARRYARLNLDGIELVERTARELGFDCGFERRTAVTFAETEAGRAKVEREAAAAGAAGLPVRGCDAGELGFPVLAAIELAEQAQFDPVAWARGVAAKLPQLGCRVFERTRVTGVGFGSPFTVRTEAGPEVKAGAVVVATHAPILDRGLYFARLMPNQSHCVAAPASGPSPSGMYLSRDERTRSIRTIASRETGERMVLVAGEGHDLGGGDPAGRYEALAGYLSGRFEVGEVSHRWSAYDEMSPDRLPFIGRYLPGGDRMLVATGFSKWGLAAGAGASEVLAARLRGEPGAGDELFDPSRFNRAQVRPTLEENAKAGAHFVMDRLRRRGNPRCTHLGCLLSFNHGDRTWDCPCHGSRFALDGSVLEGPATKPIDPPPPPGIG